MPYHIFIKRSAEKELDALPARIRERIIRRLMALEADPHLPGIKKLQGENAFRLRVGDYRVLYTIEDQTRIITIYAIGHRSEVYRG
jgi:mRNA interferase RelE/StbE